MNAPSTRESTPKKEKKPRKRKTETNPADGESSSNKPKKARTQKAKSASKDVKDPDLRTRDSSPLPPSYVHRMNTAMRNEAEFNDDDDDDLNNLTPPPGSTGTAHSGDDDDDDDDVGGAETEASADDTPGMKRKSGGGGRSNVRLIDDDDDDALIAGGDDDLFGLQLQAPDHQTLSALMAKLSPDQTARYEHYRRSKLPKNHVNKIIQNVLGQKPPASASFVVQSAGKLFIGDMVERALTVQAEMGDVGALQPKHLREAYRRYRKGPTSYASTNNSLFRNDKYHF